MTSRTVTAVDLFCGAGGFSTGLYQAAAACGKNVRLVGVNHWPTAIETHAVNHPEAQLYCESLDSLDPRKVVRGKLDILIASPECTHHSIARGGKPINDQSRSTAWHVLRWAEALQPRTVLIENVREFTTWGPLCCDGRPMKRRRGETFHAFIGALRSLGYTVDWRVLNAANYGDATTRERLFIVAGRGRVGSPYPIPTHAKNPTMYGEQRWRAAREIIDWSIRGRSIHDRQKPLAEATLRRIESGIRRYWGEWAEPFLVVLRGTGTHRRIGEPIPAVTAGGTHLGLVEPFTIGQQSGATPRKVRQPLSTVSTDGAISLVEPFITAYHNGSPNRNHGISHPVPTLDTSNRLGIVEPFIVNYYGNGDARPIGNPLDTITTKDRFALVDAGALGISFRMLQPHELAAAMSFPSDYRFAGTKTDTVKQIGNAVPVRTARALISTLIS